MCDAVIVSIFVNPTQFNDRDDLDKYPRDLMADAAVLTEYDADCIYAPDVAEVYPEGFSTYVTVESLGETLEGAARPGHFRGVATVVTILLNTVRPDFVFFGQKDAQQVAVVKRLTRDLGFETEVIVVPTVREQSGLALSSRNQRLSAEERQRAAIIIQALREAKLAFKKGERSAARLIGIVEKKLHEEEQVAVEYVAVVDRESFSPLERVGDDETLIVTAARVGQVRLLDNVLLNRKQ
jgi:pantoate--beta-alanine ligase